MHRVHIRRCESAARPDLHPNPVLARVFAARGIAEPNMADYLDWVALGTVADVVPLDRNNRMLVEQRLRRMHAGGARPSIAALFEVGKRAMRRADGRFSRADRPRP